MKTLDDFMDYPEIVNEPMALREIHAARFMLQEKRQNMTAEERRADIRKNTESFFADSGFTPQYVNFSGQGKIRPR